MLRMRWAAAGMIVAMLVGMLVRAGAQVSATPLEKAKVIVGLITEVQNAQDVMRRDLAEAIDLQGSRRLDGITKAAVISGALADYTADYAAFTTAAAAVPTPPQLTAGWQPTQAQLDRYVRGKVGP